MREARLHRVNAVDRCAREVFHRKIRERPARIHPRQRSYFIDHRHAIAEHLREDREPAILRIQVQRIVREIYEPLARRAVRVAAELRHCDGAA